MRPSRRLISTALQHIRSEPTAALLSSTIQGIRAFQMKSDEYTSLLAEALKNNTSVTDLALG